MDMDIRIKGRAVYKTIAYALVLLMLWLGGVVHAGTVTYVYTDAQGTPLAEADASGNITATFDYVPYGSQALGTPPSGPGYTGHVNDPDTGLVYMQARYYDPAVGRFLSVDPVGPAPGKLFNFNRYAYVNNNPVANTDPDGRCIDGITCAEMGRAHVEWRLSHPGAPADTQEKVAIVGFGVMVSATLGPVSSEFAAAANFMMRNALFGRDQSVASINIGRTTSQARKALEDAGYPGKAIANSTRTEVGTQHDIPQLKMSVRVMDGNTKNAPRAVTNSIENPKQMVNGQNGKPFPNTMPKAEKIKLSHFPLRKD